MKRFIQRFSDKITGVLSGFDRLVIRGTIRAICLHNGMRDFAYRNGVLLKDFGTYSQQVTKRIREISQEVAQNAQRPFIYLPSNQTNKEEIALGVLKEKPIKSGLICMLSCVEPCKSFKVIPNRESKKIEMRAMDRMCLHIYHYLIHPVLGFMNVRLQTWFPLSIQICINGREWLARQMDQAHIQYRRLDNCFPWVSDVQKAQALMNQQLKTNWPSLLNPIVKMVNPLHSEIFRKIPLGYYWSSPQTEWASDIMFKTRSDLAQIYSAILPHALTSFSSPDVMRFLGKKLDGNFQREVITDYKKRLEGARIKHRAGANSVKVYDKFQIVLRVETTINDPRGFLVYRPVQKDPVRRLAWQRLRQGVADLHRRAQISQASNERYLDALAEIDSSTRIGQLLDQISSPVRQDGKRFRALRPSDPQEIALFQAVSHGRFSINGFRNRDIQQLLFKSSALSKKEQRSRSGKISRLIRLLRAHHLVRRVPHSYRYLLTTRGTQILTQILTAILSLRAISLEQLKRAAA